VKNFLFEKVEMDYKEIIIESLETLRQKELSEKQPFKAKAYATVISQIKSIESIKSYEDLKEIKGIGKKIEEKMKEIFTTGSLASAKRAEEIIKPFQLLTTVYGIGPAKAKELVKAGITTIEELVEASEKDESLLSDVQKIGLKYYTDLQLRIPFKEMQAHEKLLKSNIPKSLHSNIVGSYRRNLESSGDIDLLLQSDDSSDLDTLVSKLIEKGYITNILAYGKHKFMGICKLPKKPHRHIDILLTPSSEYPFALLYFTGSNLFNIAMRSHASTLGYTLNEKALIKKDKKRIVGIKTEEEIFEKLGLTYKSPPERKDASSIN
jgi:DNA polymerase/3'-5' exonuclease PolX